jgi:hypothetical protein
VEVVFTPPRVELAVGKVAAIVILLFVLSGVRLILLPATNVRVSVVVSALIVVELIVILLKAF